MAALIHDNVRIFHPSRRRPRRGAIWSLGAALVRWARWRREGRELARMDDRELRDIGITDCERRALLDAPFWRN